MHRWLTRDAVGLVGLMVLAAGCGTDPFSPPPAVSPTLAAEPDPVKTFFLISPLATDADTEGWGGVAQREANSQGLVFRNLGPSSAETSTAQPMVVRRAIEDGASALLVIPSTALGLSQALAEAESKKIPVVLIGSSLPVAEGTTPFTVVVPEPFAASAEKIVATTLDDALKIGLSATGSALIVIERDSDLFAGQRVDALRQAAEKVGLKPKIVEFNVPVGPESAEVLTQAILATPDLSVVLAGGESAMQLASKVRQDLLAKAKFLVGGYVSFKNGMAPGLFNGESCTVEFRGDELARLAVTAALERLKGTPSGTKYELPTKFKKGQGVSPVGIYGAIEQPPGAGTTEYKRSSGVELLKKPPQ